MCLVEAPTSQISERRVKPSSRRLSRLNMDIASLEDQIARQTSVRSSWELVLAHKPWPKIDDMSDADWEARIRSLLGESVENIAFLERNCQELKTQTVELAQRDSLFWRVVDWLAW